MFNRDDFREHLESHYSSNNNNVQNIYSKLVDIAEILAITIGPDTNKIEHGLTQIFPLATSIEDIINGSNSENYVNALADIFKTPSFQARIKSISNTYDLNSELDFQNYFSAVESLTELYIADIEITDTDLVDLLSITKALMNIDNFKNHMNNLEHALQEFAKTNPSFLQHLQTKNQDKSRFYHNPEDNKGHKILSSYFYHWALENGFNPNKYAKLVKFIELPIFISILKDKIIFKDKGAGGDHGAWSHIAQLYYIIEENKLNKFLQQHPSEIYSHLGKAEYVGKNKLITWYSDYARDVTAWDIFFDRLDSNDLRTPPYLTNLIQDNEAPDFEWPILCESIKRQLAKKEITDKNNDNSNTPSVIYKHYK